MDIGKGDFDKTEKEMATISEALVTAGAYGLTVEVVMSMIMEAYAAGVGLCVGSGTSNIDYSVIANSAIDQWIK